MNVDVKKAREYEVWSIHNETSHDSEGQKRYGAVGESEKLPWDRCWTRTSFGLWRESSSGPLLFGLDDALPRPIIDVLVALGISSSILRENSRYRPMQVSSSCLAIRGASIVCRGTPTLPSFPSLSWSISHSTATCCPINT